jgi:hypothetical protein
MTKHPAKIPLAEDGMNTVDCPYRRQGQSEVFWI